MNTNLEQASDGDDDVCNVFRQVFMGGFLDAGAFSEHG